MKGRIQEMMPETEGSRFVTAGRGLRHGRTAKLINILARPAHWRALRHGVAAAVEHEALVQRLTPRIIVDAGANRGQFALAARRAAPMARIFAFEPLPVPAAVFRRVFANDANTCLFEAALAPSRTAMPMHVSRRDDSSSLLPIGPAQTALFAGTEEVRTCLVEAGPLADFLEAADLTPPALFKIDVQGYELEVLRASEPLLHRFAHLYVEASFVTLYEGQALVQEVIAYLVERGFRLSGCHNLVTSAGGEPVQADFLFRNTA